MSLKQHGSHTAKNSTAATPNAAASVNAWAWFIMMCAKDAQVLTNT